MKYEAGNIWQRHAAGRWVVIPTNGDVKSSGLAVMGAGLARQAADWFPGIARLLGERLESGGNHVFLFPDMRLATFPTKDHWPEKSSLPLIERSCIELYAEIANLDPPVYLPKVGCGLGGLDWKDVKPILEAHLDDRFVLCDPDASGIGTAKP